LYAFAKIASSFPLPLSCRARKNGVHFASFQKKICPFRGPSWAMMSGPCGRSSPSRPGIGSMRSVASPIVSGGMSVADGGWIGCFGVVSTPKNAMSFAPPPFDFSKNARYPRGSFEPMVFSTSSRSLSVMGDPPRVSMRR
jgi:hypothetical protein